MNHPVKVLLLGAAVVLCALGLVACGGSSSSSTSSTSASVATGSKTTGSTTAGGATTGSASAGSTGSTQPGQTNRRRVKRATRGNASKAKRRVAAGRLKGSTLRRCLEQNGVKPHAPKSKGATRGQLAAALARCDQALVPRRSPRTAKVRRQLLARPAYRKALARFTSCMRAHGVPNFPAANTTGKGPVFSVGAVKPTPQVRAAQRACIGQLSLR